MAAAGPIRRQNQEWIYGSSAFFPRSFLYLWHVTGRQGGASSFMRGKEPTKKPPGREPGGGYCKEWARLSEHVEHFGHERVADDIGRFQPDHGGAGKLVKFVGGFGQT